MHHITRSMVAVSFIVAVSGSLAYAEQAKPAQPMMDPQQQAAMAAMQQAGSPSEGHKVLALLAGTWNYTAQFWMSPEAAVETMAGTSTNSLIFGGRFLKQEIRGTMNDQPPFEGVGFTGYDNIRKEYQSVWLDNMATGTMLSTGQFDPSSKVLTEQGDFSCPMTGEAHHWFRSDWKIVDDNHLTYESYSRAPDGKEYKAMEILYTRAQ